MAKGEFKQKSLTDMADMTKTNKGRWLKLSKTLAYTLRSNTDGMTIEQFKTINWLPQWIVDMESWHIASFAMYDKQKDGANRFHLFTWTTYGEKECVNMEDLPNFPSLVKSPGVILLTAATAELSKL